MEKKVEPHIVKAALHLNEAFNQGEGVAPVISEYPAISLAEAYEVQLYNISQQLTDGHTIIGKKIGFTSKAMQESIGAAEPDYGHLLDNMLITKDRPFVFYNCVLQPRVEGKLAFILKKDLVGASITLEDVLNATDRIVAAIEITDSRIKNWNITLRDTAADNGSSAYYILGDDAFKPYDMNRADVSLEIYRNGVLIDSNKEFHMLGDPAYYVAWLANKLNEFDIPLKSGEVILSGAFSQAIDAHPGDSFTCKFTEGFGDITINFTN